MKVTLAPMTKIQPASYATRMFMTSITQAACASHSLAADGYRYGKQSRRAETGCFQRGGQKIPHRRAHRVTKCYVMVRILKVQLKLPNSSTNDTEFPNLSHDIVKHALKCAVFLRSMLYK